MTDQPAIACLRNGQVLLIVDDDKAFLQRLARAMEKRGFVTETAESVAEARAKVEAASRISPSSTCGWRTATVST